MKIWQMSVEIGKIDHGTSMEEYQRAAALVREKLNAETPILVNSLVRVDYDTKTDRYVASFEGGGKTLKLKVTNQVAQFLATNISMYGSWQIHMIDGLVTDANLVQV